MDLITLSLLVASLILVTESQESEEDYERTSMLDICIFIIAINIVLNILLFLEVIN